MYLKRILKDKKEEGKRREKGIKSTFSYQQDAV
jgi:hypothetical protein